MRDRDGGGGRPFGRRLPEGVGAPRTIERGNETPDRVPDWGEPGRGTGSLAWAVRTAAVAGFLAIVATQYLARLGAPGEAAIRVALGRTGPADPETTGSIAAAPGAASAAARATRLDPCALPATARPRP